MYIFPHCKSLAELSFPVSLNKQNPLLYEDSWENWKAILTYCKREAWDYSFHPSCNSNKLVWKWQKLSSVFLAQVFKEKYKLRANFKTKGLGTLERITYLEEKKKALTLHGTFLRELSLLSYNWRMRREERLWSPPSQTGFLNSQHVIASLYLVLLLIWMCLWILFSA